MTQQSRQGVGNSIVPTARSGVVPVSSAQHRLWFLSQLEGGSAAYHIPFGMRLAGPLDRRALQRALDRIVARHEVLRTSFGVLDGAPIQQIAGGASSTFALRIDDVSADRDAHRIVAGYVEDETGAPFDLATGPLIRGRLIRQDDELHTLLITMHHIVSDGWSMRVLLRELGVLYGAFSEGRADPLPPLEVQYADYAVWQRHSVDKELVRQQTEYWTRTLRGAPSLLELPSDRPRPAQQDYAGAVVPVLLGTSLTAGLKALSRRHGTTLYMTLLAGWAALLTRLAGQPEIVIGSAVANRQRREVENVIGLFVNTLALRLDVSGSPSVAELLARVKVHTLAAQDHQDVPFEQVVHAVRPVRSPAHGPLVQVMFTWHGSGIGKITIPGLEVESLHLEPDLVSKFDVSLTLRDSGTTIVGTLEYATALFDRETMERHAGYLRTLLAGMIADDSACVNDLPLLTESERQQVLLQCSLMEER
jgi:hypothetical protein